MDLRALGGESLRIRFSSNEFLASFTGCDKPPSPGLTIVASRRENVRVTKGNHVLEILFVLHFNSFDIHVTVNLNAFVTAIRIILRNVKFD